MKKPSNAQIFGLISTRRSPTGFGTLIYHHQGVNHNPAEIGAQCCRNQRWMEAVYCSRWREGQGNTLAITVKRPSISDFCNIGHLSQLDHDWLPVCWWHFRVPKHVGESDHTQWRATVGRTPLDEWSACRRDLYLTTHNTHNIQTSMLLVGFEPTIAAGERPYIYALDRAATGTGRLKSLIFKGLIARRLYKSSALKLKSFNLLRWKIVIKNWVSNALTRNITNYSNGWVWARWLAHCNYKWIYCFISWL
jgi:hypothetical protein